MTITLDNIYLTHSCTPAYQYRWQEAHGSTADRDQKPGSGVRGGLVTPAFKNLTVLTLEEAIGAYGCASPSSAADPPLTEIWFAGMVHIRPR